MKAYIREILNKRKELSDTQHQAFSESICQKIIELAEYKNAENLLVFYPYSGEADILFIAKDALDTGKNVFFPKVTGETTMDFIKVESLKDFTDGYKGIKEPIDNIIYDRIQSNGKTIMILPGSVFDTYGNRCGYGKGYYDRYLQSGCLHITKVGVCFSLQMMKKIPDVKETDIPMDYVITEETVFRSGN